METLRTGFVSRQAFARILVLTMAVMASAAGNAAEVASIEVQPPVSRIQIGTTQRFTATGNFTDGIQRRLSNTTLAAGRSHACTVVYEGSIRCWGDNDFRQLGTGGTADSTIPVVVSGNFNVTSVAAGADHTCAIDDTQLRCWGRNDAGQLGRGTTIASENQALVPGITDPVAIAGGFQHTCAVLATGGVRCWGANSFGQLGTGNLISSSTPLDVTSITTAIGVAAGLSHSCAVLGTGAVRCWGANNAGQLGNGSTNSSTTPVTVSGLTDAVAVGAGGDFSCALRAGGGVRCWGRNVEGQLGNGGTSQSLVPVSVILNDPAVTIATGFSHACAVLTSAATFCWGNAGNGQLGNGVVLGQFPTPVPVSFMSDAIAIATGTNHSCATLPQGQVRCWGLNDQAQLGADSPLQRSGTSLAVIGTAFRISGGGYHFCAISPAGKLWCWGDNGFGALGINSFSPDEGIPVPRLIRQTDFDWPATAVASGDNHTCALFDADQGVWCWGRNDAGQVGTGNVVSPISSPFRVLNQTAIPAALDAGSNHSCIVTTTGTVQCWGGNSAGQLGNGTTNPATSPQTVSGINTATAVATGSVHSCAVLSGGTVRCWGNGAEGQLGTGMPQNSLVPLTVTGISTATAVTAGVSHTCARLVGGALRCWGRGDEGQLGNGSFTDQPAPVVVTGITTGSGITGGAYHTCARLSTGDVRCWGKNGSGQLGNGGLANSALPVAVPGLVAVNVDAGGNHTCALAAGAGSKMVCWGSNVFGQLGNGTKDASLAPATVSGLPVEAVALGWTQVAGNGGILTQTGHLFGTITSFPAVRASYGDVFGDGLAIVDADSDDDGILDFEDNCLLVPNASQCDSDADAYGNICDGDLSNNRETNSQDYILFRTELGKPSIGPTYNKADFNCNGFVNSQDFILFRGLLGRPPGPSHPADD